MTRTATPSEALHPLRRRHPRTPATWERVGAASGMVGAVLLVTAMAIVSTTPSVGSSAGAVRDNLANHYGPTVAAAYVTVLASVLLVPFLASLSAFTERFGGDAPWRSTITLVAGATAVAMLSLGGALLGTAARLADLSAADDPVHAALMAAKITATLALLPVATVVVVNARTIASSRRPERWLVRFDIEIAGIAVLGSAAAFLESDWFGPGETVVTVAWLSVVVWILAIGGSIMRGEVHHPDEDGS